MTPWSRIDNGKSMYLDRLVRFCVVLRFVVTAAIAMFAMGARHFPGAYIQQHATLEPESRVLRVFPVALAACTISDLRQCSFSGEVLSCAGKSWFRETSKQPIDSFRHYSAKLQLAKTGRLRRLRNWPTRSVSENRQGLYRYRFFNSNRRGMENHYRKI